MRNLFLCVTFTVLLVGVALAQPHWDYYTNPNAVNSLCRDGDYLWVASGEPYVNLGGGIVRWNLRDSSYTRFSVEDGIGTRDIRCIARDSVGNVWFGTESGLLRYDGRAWTSIPLPPLTGGTYAVNALAVDRENHLWLGGRFGAIHYDGSTWTVHGEAGQVNAITVDAEGGVWFAGSAGDMSYYALSYYDGIVWEYYGRRCSPGSDLTIAGDGSIWIATARGFGHLTGEVWNFYSDVDTMSMYQANSVAQGPDGSIWGMANYGLWRFDGVAWTVRRPDCWDIWALTFDEAGRMWAASAEGLYSYDGTVWTPWLVPAIVDNRVLSIAVDRERVAWFGSTNGISRFDGTNWVNGYPLAYTTLVKVAPDDSKWFGGAFGLARLSDTTWTIFDSISSPGAPSSVKAFAFDSSGNVWVASNGVYRYDGMTWTRWDSTTFLPGNFVNDLAVTPDGMVWAATSQGLAGFDGTTWRVIDIPGGPAPAIVRHLGVDTLGALWMAVVRTEDPWDAWSYYGTGLTRWDGSGFRTFTRDDGLLTMDIQEFEFDPRGRLWISFATQPMEGGGPSPLGVSWYDGHRCVQYTSADGLIYDQVNCLAFDQVGRLYCGTDYGACRLNDPDWVPRWTSAEMTIHRGWNLLSWPVIPPDGRMIEVFPFAASMFRYVDQWVGYQRADSQAVPVTDGFWLLSDRDTTLFLEGQRFDTLCVHFPGEGWRLNGNTSGGAHADSIRARNEWDTMSTTLGPCYLYDPVSGTYEAASPDRPIPAGRGFWILLDDWYEWLDAR